MRNYSGSGISLSGDLPALDFGKLEIVRGELVKEPVLVEHSHGSDSCSYEIFKTYDKMGIYFRSSVWIGDVLSFWNISTCRQGDNLLVEGVYAGEESLFHAPDIPLESISVTFLHPNRANVRKDEVIYVTAGGSGETGIWDGYLKFNPQHADYALWLWLMKRWPYESTLMSDDLPLLREEFAASCTGFSQVPIRREQIPLSPAESVVQANNPQLSIRFGNVGSLTKSHFETIAQVLECTPLLLEHSHHSQETSFHTFVTYYALEKYLRNEFSEGDRILIHYIFPHCSLNNCFLAVEYPTRNGTVIKPESEPIKFVSYRIRDAKWGADGTLCVPALDYSVHGRMWQKYRRIPSTHPEYNFWKWLLGRWPYHSSLSAVDLPLLMSEFKSRP